MHIIIIGGGAAGMISAHYLARDHQVTVIEREPILGGNIRTLNGNVATHALPPDIIMDNGVIEFHRDHSPCLHEVMRDLGLELVPVSGGSTALYLEDGRSYLMPLAIQQQKLNILNSLRRYGQLCRVLPGLVSFRLRMGWRPGEADGAVGSLLDDGPMSRWIRMLLMYGYSIPYDQIDQFPSKLAVPTLLQGAIGTKWVRLPGGSYRYIQQIIDQANSRLSIQTAQTVQSVTRHQNGVTVMCSDQQLEGDKIVLATQPGQVLGLLADPDEQETRWFSDWQENTAETVIHTDHSIYSRWGNKGYTEFDVFEKSNGADAGYNAYLNRLSGLPEDHDTQYFLAYNMEDRINPDSIIHRQLHRTPLYTADAHHHVDAIKESNGHRNTYYAGAYLYNGLHEGAAQSALALRSLFA